MEIVSLIFGVLYAYKTCRARDNYYIQMERQKVVTRVSRTKRSSD